MFKASQAHGDAMRAGDAAAQDRLGSRFTDRAAITDRLKAWITMVRESGSWTSGDGGGEMAGHSKYEDFAEFDAALAAARVELDAMAIEIPGDPAIRSVQLQLEALHGWTRDGRKPTQDEKDRLNFGLIASRELEGFPVQGSLFQLASYVIWWE